jgi:ABC-type sugar transport system ATPase subunit
MVSVAVEQLTVRYDDAADDAPSALDGATLHVASGELLVLAGPSGSGKTTLLRAVAGLEHPAAGTVRIDGQVVNGVPPRDRDVALVSQLETVFPHLTVEDNLAFALRLRRMPEDETRKRVDAEARALGLWSRLRRRPRQLSTGERQKVALGRATARRPRIFLFDEPLDGLDLTERERMRRELARLQRGLGVTTVYVTHDQRDAMALGDRVALLDRGRVVQVDTPMAVYRRPTNLTVARFFGAPPMGVLEGPLRDDGSTAWIDLAGVPLRLRPVQRAALGGRAPPGAPLAVGVRAGAVHLDGGQREEWTRTLAVVVTSVEPLGPSTVLRLRPAAAPGRRHGQLYATVPPTHRSRRGDRHVATVDLAGSFLFEPTTGAVLHEPAQ